MKNPWQNVNLSPQRQNVAEAGNFSMLWAWQNGGEKGKKEEKKEGKKKEKEEEKGGKIIPIYYIANLKFVLYILPLFNMVNKQYLSPQIFCCMCKAQ